MTRISLADPSFHPWMTHGACTQLDPDMFFPPKGDWHAGERAKNVCETACPVREQCLQYALNNQEAHGIWGGTDAAQRRRIGRRSA